MDRHEIEIGRDGQRLFEGLLFLALFCLSIPAADFLTTHWGFVCDAKDGPCTVPVAPGLMSTTGSFTIGAAFVLRDFVQRRFGIAISACAVVMGAALGGLLAPASLVQASATALLVSGFIDLLIYTFIAKKRFVTAVVTSSMLSSIVDSALFLWLAFGSLDLFGGQTLAKFYVILIALPFTRWLWKRDQRIGLAPA